MALKFGDTAKPMGNFPVAEAVDIELTKADDTKKSLQAMYDDGELGGGESLPLPEQADMILVTYENEDGDLDWKQADKNEVGGGALVFTKAEWEALDTKPAAGTQVIISDDTIPGDGGSNIPFPDYANGEYIAFSTIGGAANSYEVKEDGFINLNVGVGYSGTGARNFYINGVLVSTISINYNSTSIWLPVKKGDILSSDSGGLGQYYFYPIR